MKIVVDIPEEQYITLNAKSQEEVLAVIDVSLLIKAIKNGTPLPKGHGRLIDADLLDMKRIDYIVDGYANDADDCAEFGMMIILAPTLVEADGGDAE